ncbi:arabinosyltransferase domain-containing protein [Parasphingorhabdus pacifica]
MTDGTGRATTDLHDVSGQDADSDVRARPRLMPGRQGRTFSAAAVLIGLLGIVTALSIPLAPVVTHDVTVSWPKAGQLPEPSLAFFVPYQPVEVHVDVPCSVVRAGQRQGQPTTLASSRMPGAPTTGFSVATANDHVLVLVGGRELMRSPITGQNCSVVMHSDASGSTARIGDRSATSRQRVSDIVTFSTQLAPREAAGLHVSARTANWFENSPTASKTALLGAQSALVVLALLVLVRVDRHRRSRTAAPEVTGYVRNGRPTPRTAGLGRRLLVDAGLAGVLGGWLVLGPNTPDDSFAGMTIRNGLNTGDIGNYYRWENASEAPFTLVQNLLEPLAAISINPLVLRTPSVLAALCTWLLLSRPLLGVVLPTHARLPGVRALAAVGLLAWWLPFGLGVRPEPFAALGITAVFAFVLLAVSRRDGTGLAWLGAGALAAGLSLAVNPMGVTALAPVLVLAPRIWRLLGSFRLPATLLLGGLASTGVAAMFVDQSLFGVNKATELHRFYGPNVPWFQEITRYEYLLGFGLQGDVARRTPILITIVLVGCVILLACRNTHHLPGMRWTPVPAACLLVCLGLMWLTPSKWTHYFGALAGIGAAALTASVVLIGVAARRWADDRAIPLIGLVCTVLAVGAATVAFSGKNNWFLHSHYGVPWGEQPIRPLNNPLPWLSVVALLLIAAHLFRRDGRSVRRMLAGLPAVVGVLAVVTTVGIVLASFAVAPIRQAGSYSVGGQNLASIAGGSCGLADHVVVTPDVPGGVLEPLTGTDETVGFATGATGHIPNRPPPDGSGDLVWGSLAGGQISTGQLRTRWFALPELPESRELAISVAGRSGDGNRIALEFAGAGGILGQRILDDTAPDNARSPYPSDRIVPDSPQDHPEWRALHVAAADVPAGADRVRIRATDTTTDSAGWLATTGPRLREVVPLADFMRDRAPTLVDWSMTWTVPCLRDMPRVERGMVQPPAYLINPPTALGFGGTAAYERGIGGSFAGVREVGHQREVPTRLLGTENTPPHTEWGHLIAVDYPLRGDGYDVRTEPVARWGWRGEE